MKRGYVDDKKQDNAGMTYEYFNFFSDVRSRGVFFIIFNSVSGTTSFFLILFFL